MRVPLLRRSISPKPDRTCCHPVFLLFLCCPRAARSPAGGYGGAGGRGGAAPHHVSICGRGARRSFLSRRPAAALRSAPVRSGPLRSAAQAASATVARDAMDDASPAGSCGSPRRAAGPPPTPPCRGRGGSRSGLSGCRSGQAPSSPAASRESPGASAVGGRPTGRRSC